MPAKARFRSARICSLLRLWFAIALGAVTWGAPAPHDTDSIFFSKSFPGSKPAYFEVTVHSNGKAYYREEPADGEPIEFELSEVEVSSLFEIAERLDRFQNQLQSERKVAFTGAKTLRYHSANGDETEAKFAYTDNRDATEIVSWFETAGETGRHRMELERVVQFDRLGVNKALLLFQAAFDDGRVVGAGQFLPILNTITEDSKIMHMARARAAFLIERIEKDTP